MLTATVVPVVIGDDELLVDPSVRIDSSLLPPDEASRAIPAPMKTARPATMASTVSCCLFTPTSLTFPRTVFASRPGQQTPGARSAAWARNVSTRAAIEDGSPLDAPPAAPWSRRAYTPSTMQAIFQ